jgi:hypothetical protein
VSFSQRKNASRSWDLAESAGELVAESFKVHEGARDQNMSEANGIDEFI